MNAKHDKIRAVDKFLYSGLKSPGWVYNRSCKLLLMIRLYQPVTQQSILLVFRNRNQHVLYTTLFLHVFIYLFKLLAHLVRFNVPHIAIFLVYRHHLWIRSGTVEVMAWRRTNADLLAIGPFETNFGENGFEILTLSITKMSLKISSAK